VPLPFLPQRLSRWSLAWLPALPPLFTSLPGAEQRRRALLAAVLAALALLLRPWPPFLWLPGWCVGGLLLWALVALLRCLYWPRRWR
jgi:hypothetical protein